MALSIRDKILLSQAEKEEYERTRLDHIEIDGNDFTGYLGYSFFYDITYTRSPERSISGVIDNLNSYARFTTPRLRINFAYMNIETYRKLMSLIYAKNEYIITCYDPNSDKRITAKFYFQPIDFPELFTKSLKVLGMINYAIELTGTNADLDLLSITYHANDGTGTQDGHDGDLVLGSQFIVGTGISIQDNPPTGKRFASWNTQADGNGVTFVNGTAVTITSDLVLYAIWQGDDAYTLSFNYGQGTDHIENGNALYSREIAFGTPYGTLPTTQAKTVSYGGNNYSVYDFDGWYKTPIKVDGSEKVTAESIYEVQGNSTIYQIFTPQPRILWLRENTGDIIQTLSAKYGDKISQPIVEKNGKKVENWYTTDDENEQNESTLFTFNTMPPVSISLYAKWVDVE